MSNEYRRTVDAMAAAADEIRRIASKSGELTDADLMRLQELEKDFHRHAADKKSADRAALVAKIDPLTGAQLHSERGHTPRDLDDDPFGEPKSAETPRYANPWDVPQDTILSRRTSPAEWRARALSAIEKAPGANDTTREQMTKVIEEHDDKEARLSKLAVLTSSPAYLRWFGEMLRTGGQMPLHSREEVEAARRVRDEQRAMSLTDTSGGFLVPFQLDPSVIITSDGVLSNIRRVARVVQATGDAWHGVSSAAPDWSWDQEASEVSDDATEFAQPTIPIHTARGFIPFSHQVGDDGANLTQEVSRLLAFGRAELEASAFITGSGNGEPTGLITALLASSPTVVVNADTNNSLNAADVYDLDEALPARYRMSGSAAWMAHRAILNAIDQMETSNGSKLFPGVVGNPGQLLGVQTFEAEAMDGALATGDDYCLVIGAFDNYVIADRSSTVSFIPHLFGSSGQRPTGQSGLYAAFRTGADSVNDGAFRLLKV